MIFNIVSCCGFARLYINSELQRGANMSRKFLVLAILLLSLNTLAQDPISTDGDKYKVLLENEKVRVLEYRDLPSEKTNQNHHPAFVLYALKPFKRKLVLPIGKTIMREFKGEEVIYSDEQIHIDENVGETPTHVIMVELKSSVQAK